VAPGHVAVETWLGGHVADERPGLEAIGLAVVPENRGSARARPEEVEQQPNGGGLAGAVQAEEAERLPWLDGKVEAFHGDEAAEPFGQTVGRDGGRGGGHQGVRLGWIVRPIAGAAQRPVLKPIAMAPPQLSCLEGSSR